MGRAETLVLLALAGCLESASVPCPSGATCPGNTTCLVAAELEWCATEDQIAACGGVPVGEACTFGGAAGTCVDGLCLPAECGNRRIDAGERCDDGNREDGDGCAANCRSEEVCGNGVVDPLLGEQCDDDNHLGHDGCSTLCGLETPGWQPLTPVAPEARAGASLAYDGARGVAVLFGGVTGTEAEPAYFDDTWTWNGHAWARRRPVNAPPPRAEHALAYDASTRMVVLFGGRRGIPGIGGFPGFDDTWLWDGRLWRLANADTRPPARRLHAMAYDASRRRVVLYGGQHLGGGGVLSSDDMWEWDGAGWHLVCGGTASACGPGSRTGHGMVYDPTRDVLVLFGGSTTNDTWELAGGTWSLADPASGDAPPARRQAGMCFDVTTGTVILAGGVAPDNRVLADTWSWDGQTWTEVVGRPSPPRSGSPCATDPTHGGVVSIGQATETWTDATGWAPVAIPAEVPSAQHAAVFDPQRGLAIVAFVGGEIRAHDGDGWRREPAFPGVARRFHAMAYDERRRQIVLFGGVSAPRLDDTWIGTDGAWTQALPAERPQPRQDHAMAFDGEDVVLFGGQGDSEPFLGDTWIWNGATWTEVATTRPVPPARTKHALAYDPIRERVVLFGGTAAGLGTTNDTWEWDGATRTWTKLTPATSPLPREDASLVWDPWRRRLVLFGGRSDGLDLDDAWEYDGETWTLLLADARPPSRAGHAMFVTPDGLALYGMDENMQSPRPLDPAVWLLRWDNVDPEESCVAGLDLDGDGLAGCDDDDCWWACHPSCPVGVSCPADAPACGDGVCDGFETCRACPSDCGACEVCGDFVCDGTEAHLTCPGDCEP